MLLNGEEQSTEELVRSLQSPDGSDVEVVTTFSEAARRLAKYVPSLIVSRTSLVDGDLADFLKSQSDRPLPPVIALTDSADTSLSTGNEGVKILRLVRGSEESLTSLRQMVSSVLDPVTLAGAESRYEVLLNSVQDVVTVAPVEGARRLGNFLEVNDAACTLYGYSRAELLQMRPADLRDPEAGLVGINSMKELLKTGQARFKRDVLDKTGHRLVMDVQARLIDYDGRQAVLSIARDITEQVRTTDLLRKSEAEKKLILNTTSDSIVYYDTNLVVQWANRIALERTGRISEEVVGRHCFEIWRGEDEPCEECPLIVVRDTGEAQEAEHVDPDGRVWLQRG